jgi:hypothetical protein
MQYLEGRQVAKTEIHVYKNDTSAKEHLSLDTNLGSLPSQWRKIHGSLDEAASPCKLNRNSHGIMSSFYEIHRDSAPQRSPQNCPLERKTHITLRLPLKRIEYCVLCDLPEAPVSLTWELCPFLWRASN